MLDELLGPLDTSCTEAAVQGSSIPGNNGQQAANLAASSDQDKSIVPVRAAPQKLCLQLSTCLGPSLTLTAHPKRSACA